MSYPKDEASSSHIGSRGLHRNLDRTRTHSRLVLALALYEISQIERLLVLRHQPHNLVEAGRFLTDGRVPTICPTKNLKGIGECGTLTVGCRSVQHCRIDDGRGGTVPVAAQSLLRASFSAKLMIRR